MAEEVLELERSNGERASPEPKHVAFRVWRVFVNFPLGKFRLFVRGPPANRAPTMTARSKSRRDKNNRIRRAKNKVKELKKLKKTLGLIDDDGMDLMEKVKEITEQQKKQELEEKIKAEAREEIHKEETKDTIDHNEYVEIVHPASKVLHKYNTRTKQDQFGQYPVWYNAKKERKKQMLREGKIKKKRGRPGRKMHFIDETCNWRNIV